MVKYSQINKHNTSHKEKERQKNHIILSIDAEKAFDKVQHPFLKKILSKVVIEEAFLNLIKAIYETNTANIILNEKKIKNFPTNFRNKTRLSNFTTSIQHSF